MSRDTADMPSTHPNCIILLLLTWTFSCSPAVGKGVAQRTRINAYVLLMPQEVGSVAKHNTMHIVTLNMSAAELLRMLGVTDRNVGRFNNPDGEAIAEDPHIRSLVVDVDKAGLIRLGLAQDLAAGMGRSISA